MSFLHLGISLSHIRFESWHRLSSLPFFLFFFFLINGDSFQKPNTTQIKEIQSSESRSAKAKTETEPRGGLKQSIAFHLKELICT